MVEEECQKVVRGGGTYRSGMGDYQGGVDLGALYGAGCNRGLGGGTELGVYDRQNDDGSDGGQGVAGDGKDSESDFVSIGSDEAGSAEGGSAADTQARVRWGANADDAVFAQE